MKAGSLLVFVALLAVMASSAAHAEIYKWKDKDGSVRYSDTPPPSNIKNESIGKKTSKAQPPAPLETKPSADNKSGAPAAKDIPPVNKDEAAAKRAQEAEAQKKAEAAKQAELKFRQESCAVARKNLAMFSNGGRIMTTDDKGERHYFGDDEIIQGKANAQRDVEKFCD